MTLRPDGQLQSSEVLRVSKIKLAHVSSMEDVIKQLDFRVVRPFRGYQLFIGQFEIFPVPSSKQGCHGVCM